MDVVISLNLDNLCLVYHRLLAAATQVDEHDGSAKFITAVFRNPLIREAVIDLMDNRDGLMLGICNDFQALIKLGLLPYGKITEPDEKAPTLTYNDIGRHQSKLVNTRIASVKSPWMANSLDRKSVV